MQMTIKKTVLRGTGEAPVVDARPIVTARIVS
jgi:hypothetical protein